MAYRALSLDCENLRVMYKLNMQNLSLFHSAYVQFYIQKITFTYSIYNNVRGKIVFVKRPPHKIRSALKWHDGGLDE